MPICPDCICQVYEVKRGPRRRTYDNAPANYMSPEFLMSREASVTGQAALEDATTGANARALAALAAGAGGQGHALPVGA